MAENKSWYWKEQSRGGWSHTNGKPEEPDNYFALGIGCLQRIADSLEVLARAQGKANSDAEDEAREVRWSVFKPFYDERAAAEEAAMARLFAGKTALVPIRDHVRHACRKGAPVQPYSYWVNHPAGKHIDLVICENWREKAVAYWDGITELPLLIAGKKTKKQARYAEWLSSMNGKSELIHGC